MSDVRHRTKLSLNKETLRVLADSDLRAAVGGHADALTASVDTALHTVCGFDPPPWVSTSPPTHLCQ
ncbi:MAG TPA: hypothetical protein VG318_01295 [Actinomycetota bacterium]|nr:hypothetical protein [Actinomycetota bacterium]